MERAFRWGVWEAAWTTERVHDDPIRDVALTVELTAPSGRTEVIPAFWDGQKRWRARFCPDEPGEWRYRTRCEEDFQLDGRAGSFSCEPYTGGNPLYQHGDLRVSDDGRYLIHADGTPFLWLGDTAWNGALLSDAQSWDAYLARRAEQGFTGVQFVTTQWRAAATDAKGRTAYSGHTKIWVNPRFFQRMDRRIAAVNRHGLVAAPVMLWAVGDSPGVVLPEEQLIVLAQYLRARYDAFQVIWILGGDGRYEGEAAERWKRIGRAVFGERPRRLVTMHPGGRHWVADVFRNEPWFGFNCYQSGHGDNAEALRWIWDGPPSREWQQEPRKPSLNFEPNYEGHRSYHRKQPFDAHAVRRAAYWSLLVGVPAGVSYGAQGVWGWHLEERVPPDHRGAGSGPPWYRAVGFPGAASMGHLRRLFDALEWWRLRPAPHLLREQPGAEDPAHFVAAAATEAGDLALIYAPEPTRLQLELSPLRGPLLVRWYDPARGEFVRQETWPTGNGAVACDIAAETVLVLRSQA